MATEKSNDKKISSDERRIGSPYTGNPILLIVLCNQLLNFLILNFTSQLNVRNDSLCSSLNP